MDNTGQNARGNEPLVRFVCRFCGHKVRVAAIHAGKKAKCPRCRNVLVIPSLHGDAPSGSDAPVRLRRDLDGRPFTPPQQGDRPQEMPLRLQTMPEPLLPADPDVPANIPGLDSSAVESQEQSKLPWVIDIFAYPASIGGLLHFAFFSVAPLLLLLISATVGRMCC